MAFKQIIKEIKGLFDSENALIKVAWRACYVKTLLQNGLAEIRDITIRTVSQFAYLCGLEMAA